MKTDFAKQLIQSLFNNRLQLKAPLVLKTKKIDCSDDDNVGGSVPVTTLSDQCNVCPNGADSSEAAHISWLVSTYIYTNHRIGPCLYFCRESGHERLILSVDLFRKCFFFFEM